MSVGSASGSGSVGYDDTVRTKAELLALFQDNETGDILSSSAAFLMLLDSYTTLKYFNLLISIWKHMYLIIRFCATDC